MIKTVYTYWFLAVILSGCETTMVPTPISETARQAVYATHDSIKVGRFDMAEKYSDQSVQLIPPPLKKVLVKPIYDSQDLPDPATTKWQAQVDALDQHIKETHKP